MFELGECEKWLAPRLLQAELAGYRVMSSKNDLPVVTSRHRLERRQMLGELVLWANGNTSMIVCDLDSGRYFIDQHNVVLVGQDYSPLECFFDLVVQHSGE